MSPGHRVTPSRLLLAVLLLAAYLRLANAAANPGWFSDEGTQLNVAAHLLRGRTQYLALTGSTLLVARLPLFPAVLAALLGLAGAGPSGDPARGMAVLRTLTGSLGVATTLLLYVLGERLGGRRGSWLGLLAALAYALYPQAVVYSRFGFSYNLVAALLLLALWAAGEALGAAEGGRRAARWLGLAALAVGLAALTDLWAWALFVPLGAAGIVVARRAGWGALAALLPAALPLAVYAGVMLLRAPAALLFDARYTLLRLGGRPLAAQAALLVENLVTIAVQERWLALGLLGLLLLRPARLRGLGLLFAGVPLVLVGRSAPLASLSFYYLIPILPLAALGLGAAALAGLSALARLVGRALRPWLRLRADVAGQGAAATLVAGLAVYLALPLAGAARAGLATAIDPFLLAPADARQAAAYVNAHAAPEDVVIASPGLAWLIDARAADFQMALAYAGTATPHLPADVPRDRFAFDPRPERARYVVVDNLWRNWAVYDVPGVPALLAEVEAWPRVFAAGEISVYRRPAGD